MQSLNRLLILSYVAAATLAMGGCSQKAITGLYRATPIVVDGNAADWNDPSFYYDSNTMLAHITASDGENLYLLVRVADPAVQVKIIRSGMEIWLDTTGRGRRQIGVHFPLGGDGGPEMQEDEPSGGQQPGPRSNPEQRRARMLAQLKEVRLAGFYPPLVGIRPARDPGGVNVAFGWDTSGTMYYEAALPYNTFWRTGATQTGMPHTVGITLEVDGMVLPDAPPGGGMGGPPGGMGGPPGGGMGGGPPGGGMGGGPPGDGMGGGPPGGGMGGGPPGGGRMGGGPPGAMGNREVLRADTKIHFRVQLPH